MKKTKRTLDPSPLAERICKCGCAISFLPNRRDQLYLNNRHANYGYNHGKRKKLNPNTSIIQKILRKNDSLLRKYFNLKPREDYSFPLGIITVEGFDTRFYLGNTTQDGVHFFTSYHYRYSLWENKTQKLTFIKIEKHV